MTNTELLIFADNMFSHYVSRDGELMSDSIRESLNAFGLTKPFLFWMEEVRKNLISVAVTAEDEDE